MAGASPNTGDPSVGGRVGPQRSEILGSGDAAARATAVEREPLELEVGAEVTETLKAALGSEQLAEADAIGRALSLDDAVEHALRAAESQETVTGAA
jgi:hypothetical protein